MATDPFNNVDKAVYPEIPSELPPVGDMMSPDMEMEDEMMGEDDDFDIIEDEDGGVTITFGGEEGKKDPENAPFGANLAEYVDDKELSSISTDLVSMIEDDDSSRQEWKDTYEKGMTLLGLQYEERTEPFDGASGVVHPILNESVVQFQAQAYKELLPPGGPVRTQVVGMVTPEREAQADRVRTFMNYEITHVMEEYDPDFDQMLYYVGYGGSAFKKVYYDGFLGRATSPYILPKDLIVPYNARDLLTAERVTHVTRVSANELRKQMVAGVYREVDLGKPGVTEADEIQEKIDQINGVEPSEETDEYTLYECHCNLDLPGFEDRLNDGKETGIKLPYIVTIEKDSGEILAIRRNYKADDPLRKKRQYFVHYKFLPGMGFYGFGLVHLLGNLSRSSTSILRQLIDAGTLANLPAGFKAKGLRVQDQDAPLQPGEWRDVDAPGGSLRENLLPLPYKEPSATLFQLLGFCIGAAEKFVGTKDLGMGETNQELPVGTTIALLERGSRVMSAVHKRMHYAQMQELKLLAKVFAESLPPEYPYEVPNAERTIKAADFDDRIDILPVSDPNIYSMTQRISLAQEQLRLAQAAPQMHNLYEAYRRMYAALNVQNIDMLLPPPPNPMPQGPAQENARSIVVPNGGSPLQAFPEQDHQAHITAHVQFYMLPLIQVSPQVQGVLLSHIFEHISLLAQQQAMQQLQQPVQSMDQFGRPMMMPPPPVNPAQQAALTARIESQLQAQILQMLNPPPPDTGTDPLIQLQEKNLQLKAQQLQTKAQSDAERLAFDRAKLQAKDSLDRERIQSNEDIAQLRANVSLQRAGVA
jgi:hypothetical protein